MLSIVAQYLPMAHGPLVEATTAPSRCGTYLLNRLNGVFLLSRDTQVVSIVVWYLPTAHGPLVEATTVL
jgi:hypothetical protein